MNTFDKRIITHQWGNSNQHVSSNGFVISGGTYDKSYAFFSALAAEAKRDFPKLRDDDITCFIITKSSYNEGFSGVRFSLPVNSRKKGYRQSPSLDFYYR